MLLEGEKRRLTVVELLDAFRVDEICMYVGSCASVVEYFMPEEILFGTDVDLQIGCFYIMSIIYFIILVCNVILCIVVLRN